MCKCFYCDDEIDEDEEICFSCSYEHMDDIERESCNPNYDTE